MVGAAVAAAAVEAGAADEEDGTGAEVVVAVINGAAAETTRETIGVLAGAAVDGEEVEAAAVVAIIRAAVVGIRLLLHPGSKAHPERNLLRLHHHLLHPAAREEVVNLPISWRWRAAATAAVVRLLLPLHLKACLHRRRKDRAATIGTEEVMGVDHHRQGREDHPLDPGVHHPRLLGPTIP